MSRRALGLGRGRQQDLLDRRDCPVVKPDLVPQVGRVESGSAHPGELAQGARVGAGGVVVGRDLVGDPGAGGQVAGHLEHHAVIPQHVGGESAHGLAVAVDRAEAGRLDVEAVHLVEGGDGGNWRSRHPAPGRCPGRISHVTLTPQEGSNYGKAAFAERHSVRSLPGRLKG